MLNWCIIYQWKRQQYFFLAHLYLKQGIDSVHVMIDFIGMGLLDLWGAQTKNYKMKIFVNNGIRTYDLPLSKRTR